MAFRGRTVALATLMAAVVVVGACVGCSNQLNQPRSAVSPTTTDPKLAADMVPPPAPLPADRIVQGLQSAVAAANFCSVLTAIDVAEPDPNDAAGSTAVYRALAAATAATRPFVPKDLRTGWEVVVEATAAGATAVADHHGDIHDPDVESAMSSTAMVEALEAVERYQLTECPAPVPPA